MIFIFILRSSTTSTNSINAAEHLKHQADQQISQRNKRTEKMPFLYFFVGIVISAHITGILGLYLLSANQMLNRHFNFLKPDCLLFFSPQEAGAR